MTPLMPSVFSMFLTVIFGNLHVMKCRILAGILFVISFSKSEDLCVDEAIETLAGSLGINSFTFVQEPNNARVLEKVRRFSGSGLFSVVTSSAELEEIWSDEMRKNEFFDRRTILVVEEEFNFSRGLEKLSDVESVTWAAFLKSPDDIKTAYIPFSANFFTLHCTSNATTINKAYHVKPGLRLSVKNTHLAHRISNTDFEKATLNVLFLFDEEECRRRTHVLNKIECFHQEIVRIISEKLNATINRFQCPEKFYPYNYPNGSLSEMFLILQRGEADISSGSYIISKSRMEFYDFAWPVFGTRSMMYIKYESVKSRWRAYIRPIDNGVWSATLSWIIVTGVLFRLFEESHRPRFKLSFSLLPGFIKSVFVSLQVFCSQGVHNIPQWNSNRIILLFSFILCVALFEAYCAVLISSLTVTTPNIPFTDLDEFLNDGTYKLLTLRHGYHNYFVKKTLRESGNKAIDLLQDDNQLPIIPQSAIDLLCAGERVTYVEFRENIVRNEIRCKMLELPKPLFKQNTGLGLPKNSPYKEILRQYINLLRSSGIVHRMRRYLLSYMTLQQRETSDDQFIHVTLWHVVSIFLIMAVGTVLSMIIFLLEVILGFSNSPKILNKKRGRRKTLKTKHFKQRFVSPHDLQLMTILSSSGSKT